jgi:arylsulfatase A-like enzyme
MQLLIAVGVALAWGLVGGVIDASLLGGVEFATPGVAVAYTAASALFSAAASLPVALGLWGSARIARRGRDEARGRELALLLAQVGALLVPLCLVVLIQAQKRLLPITPVFSLPGLALTAGIVLGAVAVGAALATLGMRFVRSSFRGVAWAGYAGTAIALGVVALGVSGRATGTPAGERRPNVLLISIDSLRSDVFYEYVERHASPVLRRFVTEGRQYRNAHTTYSHSLAAHASMFTGRYPPEHGAFVHKTPEASVGSALAAGVRTLADRFREEGYETVAILSNAWVGPPFGLESGFDTYINYGISRRIGHFDPLLAAAVSVVGPYLRYADRRLVDTVHPNSRLFLRWLATRDRSRPFFAFLHYIEMHTPNVVPQRYMERFCSGPHAREDGRQIAARMEAGEFSAADLPEVLSHVRNLHFADLAQMDDFIAPVLEELLQGGLDDTLVFLVADHGENLYEKADSYGKSHVYHTSSQIPFVVRVPGVSAGSVSGALVSLVDIAPTAYAFTGVDPRGPLSGLDLLSETRTPGGTHDWIYVQGWDAANDGYARAILFADGRKWLRNGAGRDELYDLRSDPEELRDVAGSEGARATLYRARFDQILAGMQSSDSQPLGLKELPPEVVEQLKAMGYLQ